VIDDEAKKILEFGAYHFIRQAPYEQVIQNFLNTLAVIYFQQAGTFNDEVFRLINRVFRKLTGNEFRWHDITRTQDGSAYEIRVMSEGESDALPIQKVSQGTLSVLSMIGVIFQYLDLRYGQTVSRSELTKQSAIIVIDEIDAHLHPSWQQKIIGIIRSEFPNVQFIISAHSPVIVAGCKEGEVSVMRKTAEGFAIETIVDHLIGVPIADLFQMVFEIEEKDETYLQLAALMPFKGMILKEIETLTSRGPSLNEKDRARLEELEEQAANFNYFESFQAIKSNKTEKEELQRKYEELKVDYDRLVMEMNQSKSNIKK
jgi:predicted ATP-binding protein involved in virulence